MSFGGCIDGVKGEPWMEGEICVVVRAVCSLCSGRVTGSV